MARLTWTQGPYSESGKAGGIGGIGLFTIVWGITRSDRMWSLGTSLPISSALLGQHYRDKDEAKVAAETLLSSFIALLDGATQDTP